jgi:hypothetical protein
MTDWNNDEDTRPVAVLVAGRLFASNERSSDQTDIIFTLNPHIIRVLDLSEADLRAFRVGHDGSGGGPQRAPELVPVQVPAPAPPAPPPTPQPR